MGQKRSDHTRAGRHFQVLGTKRQILTTDGEHSVCCLLLEVRLAYLGKPGLLCLETLEFISHDAIGICGDQSGREHLATI